MAALVWIASYPRSGNTWTRLLLQSLIGPHNTRPNPFTPASDRCNLIASSRSLFDNLTGLPSSDMRQSEIDAARPEAFRRLAQEAPETLFVKVHDIYCESWVGNKPESYCLGAIYLVRDPRDVACSVATFMGISIDDAIAHMRDHAAILGPRARAKGLQFRQRLGSWNAHVKSWRDQVSFPVILFRYEDLLADTAGCLGTVAAAFGLDGCAERIAGAVASTQFDCLSAAERRDGFSGWRGGHTGFFRQGRAGGWRQELSGRQIAAIERDHGEVMSSLGYTTLFT